MVTLINGEKSTRFLLQSYIQKDPIRIRKDPLSSLGVVVQL